MATSKGWGNRKLIGKECHKLHVGGIHLLICLQIISKLYKERVNSLFIQWKCLTNHQPFLNGPNNRHIYITQRLSPRLNPLTACTQIARWWAEINNIFHLHILLPFLPLLSRLPPTALCRSSIMIHGYVNFSQTWHHQRDFGGNSLGCWKVSTVIYFFLFFSYSGGSVFAHY